MTTHYDRLYEEQFWQILKEGFSTIGQDVRTVWNDKGVKTPAYTIEYLNKQLRFESGGVPLLTSKYVFWKLAIKEMFWIWVWKSNVVNDLRKLNGTEKWKWVKFMVQYYLMVERCFIWCRTNYASDKSNERR